VVGQIVSGDVGGDRVAVREREQHLHEGVEALARVVKDGAVHCVVRDDGTVKAQEHVDEIPA